MLLHLYLLIPCIRFHNLDMILHPFSLCGSTELFHANYAIIFTNFILLSPHTDYIIELFANSEFSNLKNHVLCLIPLPQYIRSTISQVQHLIIIIIHHFSLIRSVNSSYLSLIIVIPFIRSEFNLYLYIKPEGLDHLLTLIIKLYPSFHFS